MFTKNNGFKGTPLQNLFFIITQKSAQKIITNHKKNVWKWVSKIYICVILKQKWCFMRNVRFKVRACIRKLQFKVNDCRKNMRFKVRLHEKCAVWSAINLNLQKDLQTTNFSFSRTSNRTPFMQSCTSNRNFLMQAHTLNRNFLMQHLYGFKCTEIFIFMFSFRGLWKNYFFGGGTFKRS